MSDNLDILIWIFWDGLLEAVIPDMIFKGEQKRTQSLSSLFLINFHLDDKGTAR